MKKEITGIIIIVVFGLFLSATNACECPIKIGDHVSPTFYYIIDKDGKLIQYHWHCGDIESISGKCGEWKISVRNCTGNQMQLYYSYVKVLNIQKENKSCWNFLNKSITTNDIKTKKD